MLNGCRISVIEETALVCIKLRYFLRFRIIERKIKNIEILFHSLFLHAFRNPYYISLKQPSQNHLRNTFAVFIGYLFERLIFKKIIFPLSERRPARTDCRAP